MQSIIMHDMKKALSIIGYHVEYGYALCLSRKNRLKVLVVRMRSDNMEGPNST